MLKTSELQCAAAMGNIGNIYYGSTFEPKHGFGLVLQAHELAAQQQEASIRRGGLTQGLLGAFKCEEDPKKHKSLDDIVHKPGLGVFEDYMKEATCR